MNTGRRQFLSGLLSLAAAGGARAAGEWQGPRFRVAADGWGQATAGEVEGVLKSAAGVLWKFFPGQQREPFVVLRGREGPIVLYQRNVVGEIVLKLDTEDYLWCQYVYQFSHEFCHILSGFEDRAWKRNNWFEETICEVASLFVLRRLSEVWAAHPPNANWQSYAPEFRRYAQGVMDGRTQVGDGHLGDFYRKHRRTLEETPRDRSLNGAMALPLLKLFEGAPESWEAVAWLNRTPSLEGGTFAEYLENWRSAVPAKHRNFVGEVRRRFGLEDTGAGAAGPPGPEHSCD